MERDDLINDHEYSVAAYHDEEHGKATRKNIVKVTIILSVLTAAEVIMGVYFARAETVTWTVIKLLFIFLTLVKAAYIVLSFMHLGDERKSLKKTILIPYVFFILYMISLIILSEANYVNEHVGPLFD